MFEVGAERSRMHGGQRMTAVAPRRRAALAWSVVSAMLFIATARVAIADDLDKQVSASSDDAMEDGGSVTLSDSKHEMGGKPWNGFRFTNVTVPKFATITSAYLEFKADDSTSGDVDLTIYGQDADNPGTFTDTSSDVSGRTKTSASYAWNNVEAWTAGSWHQTPSLVSIVQEIVNRPGFASGNAMVFLFSDMASDKRIARAYEAAAADAAKLHIEYSVGNVLWLADHTAGQETDAFSQSGGETDAELFGFKLDLGGATITVTELALSLSSITGLQDGDWAGLELVIDTNDDGDIGGGESTTVGGSGVVNQGAGTITFSTDFNVSSATSYILRGDFASLATNDEVTIGLASGDITSADDVTGTSTSVTHVERCYTETFQSWSATSADTWQTKDLSGAPFNVPANAVIEVAVYHTNTSYQRWGGVREIGPNNDRRFQLHEAESGGSDVVVMHVKTNGSSQIQHYSDATSSVKFHLLGYWDCGTYIEKWQTLAPSGYNAWVDHNLSGYGVGAADVAEVVMLNAAASASKNAGVRTNGSGLERKTLLHWAESGGYEVTTMFASADGTANATIDLFAQDANVSFRMIGYWSVPPYPYTEKFEDIGGPSSDLTWQDVDLTSFNVPAAAVVDIGLNNTHASYENRMGVQANGKTLARVVDLQEAEPSGVDAARMHAAADENSIIHAYHEDVSDGFRFDLLGYWSAPLGPYTDASATVGFDVQSTTGSATGSGLHWADLDADGDLDAVITGNSFSRKLVSNSEGTSFTVTTFGAGGRSRQAALLDLDNDGDVDVWHADETLFENDGSGSFSDEGDMGFSDAVGTDGLAAADVNNDGWCDVVMFSGSGNWIGHHQGDNPVTLVGTNAASYGLNDAGDSGNGDYVSSVDVNGDTYLDFFYNYGTGKLFLSDGDGTYTESASGISVVTGSADLFGSAWGDYDNDGDPDLYVPRYDAGSAGYLWRNDAGTFTNVASAAGITDTSGQRSACWGDYDNDGDLDLYVTTHSGADNLLYQNQNNGTFLTTDAGVTVAGDSHDAVFVDYDNDGDLDLAVTQQSGTNILLDNDTDGTSYLKVRAIGYGRRGTNKAAVGVRVELYTSDGLTLLGRRDLGVARGFGGTEPLWAHFGGVTDSVTYKVKVHFASGVQEVNVVPSAVSTTIGATVISQMVTVTEPKPPYSVVTWQEVKP
ncbi:MAG: VCBS repeat-containing protein [Planctomycetes bacterium]|nr:VCBS repeat-containing protein [Planctomycetota bacterium]